MDSPDIRVAILDDNAKFRKSLGKLIGKEPGIHVVAEVETGLAATREVKKRGEDQQA